MNPVEIEQALSDLAEQPFDSLEFPFQFLECFGNKPTTLKKLRSGASNKSDIENGVLQRSNIHLATCAVSEVSQTLQRLVNTPETTKAKVSIVLATDGHELQAENVITGETVASDYKNFPDHFGFYLPLAGIATTKEILNNPIDVKATGRLNRLYVELLKHNENWGAADRRHDMNQFMTRLIFCFFAEDTGIFQRENMFTKTVEQMSDSKSENTHEVLSTLFHALDLEHEDREKKGLPRWTNDYPYVNGGLFAGTRDVPKFSRIARSYLIRAGNLNWKEINPDIFGSMIQAVADDEERGSIGMHYTSVPNILKVLNPLFLDDLREHLEEAGDNARKLLNLKKRISKIRVFDPACGSGNFLVIAYKEMRAIEFEIHKRRQEEHLKSEIPLSNFRGIEILEFPTEIARLALIIAEYQCDEMYRGQKDALADFLPLDSNNWIVCGNALRLDWLSICPPTETNVKHLADDLFSTPLEQAEVDFENEGGETYVCGNPPYKGSQQQTPQQKEELRDSFVGLPNKTKILDYVCGWFGKASKYVKIIGGTAAFVATNSINQGRQVEVLWRTIFDMGLHINFAHTSFTWSNLASNNAGVTVVIIGIAKGKKGSPKLFITSNDQVIRRNVSNINGYLVSAPNIQIPASTNSIFRMPNMLFGNMPNDGGMLLLTHEQMEEAVQTHKVPSEFIRQCKGAHELINGLRKYCIWVSKENVQEAKKYNFLNTRFEEVKKIRASSNRASTCILANTPYSFGEVRQKGNERLIIVPIHTSEKRDFLPVGLLPAGTIVLNSTFALYDAPLWNLALIASRLHLIWIATVCGKIKTDFRYSNTLGWNTFPVPTLTKKNKADLQRCSEDILLARETHFPKTIADLYKPDEIPDNLKQAHEKNDETLERIYIGRRFKNDTERLEKLFKMYTEMTTTEEKSFG
jgi:hypothetical protein